MRNANLAEEQSTINNQQAIKQQAGHNCSTAILHRSDLCCLRTPVPGLIISQTSHEITEDGGHSVKHTVRDVLCQYVYIHKHSDAREYLEALGQS